MRNRIENALTKYATWNAVIKTTAQVSFVEYTDTQILSCEFEIIIRICSMQNI